MQKEGDEEKKRIKRWRKRKRRIGKKRKEKKSDMGEGKGGRGHLRGIKRK